MDPFVLVLCAVALVALVGTALLYGRTGQVRQQLAFQQESLAGERRALDREREHSHREIVVLARDEAQRIRAAAEAEVREQRVQLQRLEDRFLVREERLDERQRELVERADRLRAREEELGVLRISVERERERAAQELARNAGLSREQAHEQLLARIEPAVRLEVARLAQQWEADARDTASRRGLQIVTQAIQRCAVQQVSETTVSVVPLPNDELKGRIIGREGRNIRAFETLTGVDVIIDDTPEAVVLSGFDPVRREIARVALEMLIADGRIHPGRIEDMVARADSEVHARIRDAGEAAALRAGVTDLDPELCAVLGRLRFRTSLGQNVLDHSVEVAHLAASLASELGVDAAVARRAGLLHDVGKAMDSSAEGSHLVLSVELARNHGESAAVIHAIEAHHGDVEFGSVEAVLVQVADAISASRPGARREMLETYLKRMQRLEGVVNSLSGVEKCYAVQAGRELRIIVRPEEVDDLTAARLARETAKKVEEAIEYPGQIKVVVIRETRKTEYAK